MSLTVPAHPARLAYRERRVTGHRIPAARLGRAAEIPVVVPLDQREQENLLLQHLPQVRRIAKQIRQRFRRVEFDDLVGYGTIGLMKAIKSFDASRGILLKTYAEYRIRGEILDGLRGMNWLSRSACRKKVEYLQSQASNESTESIGELKTSQTTFPPPGNPEPAISACPSFPLPPPLLEIQCAGWNLEDLEEIAEKTGRREAFRVLDPAAIYDRKKLVRRVAQAVSRLPRRSRQVIEMHYQRELSLKQIGEILKVHQSRVSQLHAGAIRHLRNCFAEHPKRFRAEPQLPLSKCEKIA